MVRGVVPVEVHDHVGVTGEVEDRHLLGIRVIGTITRFGTILPAGKLRFEAKGCEPPVAHTVRNESSTVDVAAVTLSTTAVASFGNSRTCRRGRWLCRGRSSASAVARSSHLHLVAQGQGRVWSTRTGWLVPVLWSVTALYIPPLVEVDRKGSGSGTLFGA